MSRTPKTYKAAMALAYVVAAVFSLFASVAMVGGIVFFCRYIFGL